MIARTNSAIEFLRDIKFEHTLFALPFAASAFYFISFSNLNSALVFKLLIAMVSARSFAMGMNRYLDYKIDIKNPRTANRSIPSGRITPREGLAWSLLYGIIFVAVSATISLPVLLCSIPTLLILSAYSFMKRWTYLTHFYLGFCLGLAPIAVAVAVAAPLTAELILMSISVMFWTAGFDLLYSLQDWSFDQSENLQSIPSRFGPRATINISRICFAIMIVCLITSGIFAKMGMAYFAGVSLIACFLSIEHFLIREAKATGQSRYLNFTFFNMNAFVSVFFFVICTLDYLI